MEYKEFVDGYIAFAQLKKCGFFPIEMKRTDYEAIVKRFLHFFGDKSMQEYINNLPEIYPDSSFISGKSPDKVNANGELKIGGGFHISWAERDFNIRCCICECEQTVSISTSTWSANKKCKGCKRKIFIQIIKDEIIVTERN